MKDDTARWAIWLAVASLSLLIVSQAIQLDNLQTQVDLQQDRIDEMQVEIFQPLPTTVRIERPACTAAEIQFDMNGC